MAVDVLDREMYTEAEAARLLRLSQSTLHYWLEGGVRRGRSYDPVLRVEASGRRTVTWAEFVEAGLLRQYRRDLRVPMAELRSFIELLRTRTGVPYPLAHHTPYVADRQLVLEAQEEAGLAADFCLVAIVREQTILTPASEAFVHRVDWRDDIAVAWRPHDDPASPVRMAPDVRFGRPSLRGISTEALWEQSEGGEFVEETADDFGVAIDDVWWAVEYERRTRAA